MFRCKKLLYLLVLYWHFISVISMWYIQRWQSCYYHTQIVILRDIFPSNFYSSTFFNTTVISKCFTEVPGQVTEKPRNRNQPFCRVSHKLPNVLLGKKIFSLQLLQKLQVQSSQPQGALFHPCLCCKVSVLNLSLWKTKNLNMLVKEFQGQE